METPKSSVLVRAKTPHKTARARMFRALHARYRSQVFRSLFRPRDSQQKSAIFESFHIVRKRTSQRQQMSCRQINHFVLHMHSDVACDSLD